MPVLIGLLIKLNMTVLPFVNFILIKGYFDDNNSHSGIMQRLQFIIC